jgi:glucose-6-phosphate 1-dehydrogenase
MYARSIIRILGRRPISKQHWTIDDSQWMDTDVSSRNRKSTGSKRERLSRFVFRDGTEKVFAETPENKNNAYEMTHWKSIAIDDASYLFVRWDSVEAAWQVVDELLHCTDNCPILQIYEPGSERV